MTDSTPVRRVRLRSGLTEIGAPMGETIPTYQDYVLGEDFDRVQSENVRLKGEVERLEWVVGKLALRIATHLDNLDAAETERDSLRAQLAARDERIRGLEEAQTSMYAEGKRFEGLWRESAQQLAAALAKVEWQPIETASAEGESLFYVVPREPHEQPLFERRDKGVVQTWKPYVFQGRYRAWSCLEKATHWMPLPDPPAMTAKEGG